MAIHFPVSDFAKIWFYFYIDLMDFLVKWKGHCILLKFRRNLLDQNTIRNVEHMSSSKKFLQYAHVSVVDTGVSRNNGETISYCLPSCIWHHHRVFLARSAITLMLSLQENNLLQRNKKIIISKAKYVSLKIIKEQKWEIWIKEIFILVT